MIAVSKNKKTKTEAQLQYAKKVKEVSPASPLFKDCAKAFLFGGTVCVIGEAIYCFYSYLGVSEKNSVTGVSVTLIAIAAALTGIGVFDKIAKHAGAGTIVPITGFANSVAAPAIEFATEGHITGTAVKMFSIAGPVIVYGSAAASLYGLIYYCFCRGV